MAIRFTARHMVGGSEHSHIAKLKWIADGSTETKENTREELVTFIRDNNGKGYVRDGSGNSVSVKVVDAKPPYLQTFADGKLTDNLLSLPTY